mgnify:CR=1 FL=1
MAAGAAIGCGFAVAGLFVGRLFSPNPHVQLLVAAGMVTMGAFLPLQGWMMALDGILIGARDFRYLAITCTLTATVYIALTAICVDAAAPMLPGDLASTGVHPCHSLSPDVQRRCTFAYGEKDCGLRLARRTIPRL